MVRNTDIVTRYGGEEFIVILPNCPQNDAVMVGEKIRIKIQETVFDTDIRLTISGGIAEYKNESMDELIEKADKLLYQAKKNGRNRIGFVPE